MTIRPTQFAFGIVLLFIAFGNAGSLQAAAAAPQVSSELVLPRLIDERVECRECTSDEGLMFWLVEYGEECSTMGTGCAACPDDDSCDFDFTLSDFDYCARRCIVENRPPVEELLSAIDAGSAARIASVLLQNPASMSLNLKRAAIQVATDCGGISASYSLSNKEAADVQHFLAAALRSPREDPG